MIDSWWKFGEILMKFDEIQALKFMFLGSWKNETLSLNSGSICVEIM